MDSSDILPNNQDYAMFEGKLIRKGTIAAFMANLKILQQQPASSEAYQHALKDARSLYQDVKQIGLFEYFEFKDQGLKMLVEQSILT